MLRIEVSVIVSIKHEIMIIFKFKESYDELYSLKMLRTVIKKDYF